MSTFRTNYPSPSMKASPGIHCDVRMLEGIRRQIRDIQAELFPSYLDEISTPSKRRNCDCASVDTAHTDAEDSTWCPHQDDIRYNYLIPTIYCHIYIINYYLLQDYMTFLGRFCPSSKGRCLSLRIWLMIWRPGTKHCYRRRYLKKSEFILRNLQGSYLRKDI